MDSTKQQDEVLIIPMERNELNKNFSKIFYLECIYFIVEGNASNRQTAMPTVNTKTEISAKTCKARKSFVRFRIFYNDCNISIK